MSRLSRIRWSRREDLPKIRAWLETDDRQGVENFLCNWEIIEDAHRDRSLLVYVDDKTGDPVAFQVGQLIGPGILEVRNDFRRRGIGQKLVEHCVKLAGKRDCCCLYIQCNPASSIPFWKKMGFTLMPNDETRHAYRVLPKHHELPVGRPVEVKIQFYCEERRWDKNVPAYASAILEGVQTAENVVCLPERVCAFRKLCPEPSDALVEIATNGKTLYFDKAKYSEASNLGVRRCANAFYVDKIFPDGNRR